MEGFHNDDSQIICKYCPRHVTLASPLGRQLSHLSREEASHLYIVPRLRTTCHNRYQHEEDLWCRKYQTPAAERAREVCKADALLLDSWRLWTSCYYVGCAHSSCYYVGCAHFEFRQSVFCGHFLNCCVVVNGCLKIIVCLLIKDAYFNVHSTYFFWMPTRMEPLRTATEEEKEKKMPTLFHMLSPRHGMVD